MPHKGSRKKKKAMLQQKFRANCIHHSRWDTFSPLPQIRPKGGSIAQFCFKGIICNQKVGRHETGGEKEIWEFVLDKGVRAEVVSPTRTGILLSIFL